MWRLRIENWALSIICHLLFATEYDMINKYEFCLQLSWNNKTLVNNEIIIRFWNEKLETYRCSAYVRFINTNRTWYINSFGDELTSDFKLQTSIFKPFVITESMWFNDVASTVKVLLFFLKWKLERILLCFVLLCSLYCAVASDDDPLTENMRTN